MKIRREAKTTKGKKWRKTFSRNGKKETEEIRSLLKSFIFTTFP